MHDTHDVRGNMSSAGGARHYQYSVHNQATSVWRDSSTSPTVRARFAYGTDGQRYRRIDDGRSVGAAITTTYIGAVERRQLPGGAVQWRRHIGDKVIVQYSSETRIGNIVQASGAGTVRHQFTDHQGSVQVIGMVSGGSVTVLERLDTGPDGQWRMPDPPFGKPGSAWTTRGFTGHEHVEGLDTVHMNGRLYWISGGRFVQPDPVLTDPLNPQNWNPYSYVVNNPLNLVDPTGYSFVDTLIHPLKKVVRGLMRAAGPQVSGVVMGASCGTLPYGWGIVCAAGGGYDLARSFGANPSQARRSGVAAAFSAAVSWGLSYMGVDPSSARGVSISATAGGVSSVLQGGQFGHGFVSAGVTSYATPYINSASANPVVGATASAILGGTVSEMTGGKFRNGAMTGAFSYTVYFARSYGKYLIAGSSGARWGRISSNDIPISEGVIGVFAYDGFGPPAPFDSIVKAAQAGLAAAALMDSGIYEYGGAVIQAYEGFYYATNPVTIFESARFALNVPAGLVVRGIYHTHPAGNDGAASVFFSPDDVTVARRLKVTSYIGVYYDRSIRYFDPSTMTSSTIRSGKFTVHHGAKGGLLCKQCFN